MNEEKSQDELKIKQQRNTKKILFILGGIFLAFLLALLLLTALLPRDKQEEREIRFYPVTDENIFENSQYVSKNRTVYYCDNSAGYEYTTPITEENRSEYEAEVLFAELYLNTVILGDEIALREMCSQSFLEKNPIPEFTQQMLYDLNIHTYRTETRDDGSKLVTYKLMYKIMQNNGTYRNDVGSDGARPEYLVLHVSKDGASIKIEDILR
jgi:hypothetical protein